MPTSYIILIFGAPISGLEDAVKTIKMSAKNVNDFKLYM